MRIAVIGTGIGGLSAAWWLGEAHQVTLYERLPALGMAAHGIELGGGKDATPLRVDVPLRVVYRGYYPNLLALYDEAGIGTVPVDYSASFGELSRGTYFRYRNRVVGSASIPYLWGLGSLRRTSLRITRDLLRFYVLAARDLEHDALGQETTAEYLARRGFSADFVERFVLPAFAGIGTCSYDAVRSYPARVIVEYLTRGVFFESIRRTVHSAAHVVERLASRAKEVRCGVSIEAVRRDARGVEVAADDGSCERYDHVILATQANQALGLLDDASSAERTALGSFSYERSRVIVHDDESLAPPRRSDWAPVNFLVSATSDRPMATIWLNAVLPLEAGAAPVFQTWNPLREPAAERVRAETSFERPVVDAESSRGLDRIEALHGEPDRRLWFCGSYARAGVPLLESAASSARGVAARLGVARPDAPRS